MHIERTPDSRRTHWAHRVPVGVLAIAVLLAAVGAVRAANIAGTPGKDTLRGTAGADKLYGKGGNDKLYGRGGNDLLSGGTGNDVLVGGPGADRLSCGAGKDVAIADAKDRVARDCEVVKGIAAPSPPEQQPQPPPPPPPTQPPPAPAAAPVTAGSWKGATQNGNYVFFTVTSSRTVTGFRVNDVPDACTEGGELTGGVNFGDSTFTIQDNGSFAAQGSGDLTPQADGTTHWEVKLSGVFGSATASTGTYSENIVYRYQGSLYHCSSGTITWSAALQG